MKAMTNIIEAIIGAMIILGAMMFLFSSQPIQEQDMYNTVYSCLIHAKDYSNMETVFGQCIPSTYEFQIKTCSVSNCITSLPVNKTIISAEYIDSGPQLIKAWVYK